MAVVPPVGELMITVHEPVVPTVRHEFAPTKAAVAPLALISEKSITVPAGALTKPPPSPALMLTCPVSVWFALTGFVAAWGVIWMLASTNVLTAGPEFPPVPLVVTVNGVGVPRLPVQLALPVTLPGVGEENVIRHCPAALVFAPASSHVLAPASRTKPAPLLLVRLKSTWAPEKATKPAPSPRSF